MTGARLLPLALCLASSAGCYGIRTTMGASLLRSEVYTREGPEGPGALPVEHVQARLHGVNVFGFPARRIDVDPLLGEHLQSADQRIANLQVVAGSYVTLIFEYLFSVSWVDLSFDVVEIPKD